MRLAERPIERSAERPAKRPAGRSAEVRYAYIDMQKVCIYTFISNNNLLLRTLL